jgi:hypothetical protein
MAVKFHDDEFPADVAKHHKVARGVKGYSWVLSSLDDLGAGDRDEARLCGETAGTAPEIAACHE